MGIIEYFIGMKQEPDALSEALDKGLAELKAYRRELTDQHEKLFRAAVSEAKSKGLYVFRTEPALAITPYQLEEGWEEQGYYRHVWGCVEPERLLKLYDDTIYELLENVEKTRNHRAKLEASIRYYLARLSNDPAIANSQSKPQSQTQPEHPPQPEPNS